MKPYRRVYTYIEIAEKYGFRFYSVKNNYHPTELLLKLKYSSNEFMTELVTPCFTIGQDGNVLWYVNVNISEYVDTYGDLPETAIKHLSRYWLKLNAMIRELNAVKMPEFETDCGKDPWFFYTMIDGYKARNKRFVMKDSE